MCEMFKKLCVPKRTLLFVGNLFVPEHIWAACLLDNNENRKISIKGTLFHIEKLHIYVS